jgi:aerobic C4-dicarboxylate transport protein
MSECRSLTNFIGNAVATVVVSNWEGELDKAKLHAALDLGTVPAPEDEPLRAPEPALPSAPAA